MPVARPLSTNQKLPVWSTQLLRPTPTLAVPQRRDDVDGDDGGPAGDPLGRARQGALLRAGADHVPGRARRRLPEQPRQDAAPGAVARQPALPRHLRRLRQDLPPGRHARALQGLRRQHGQRAHRKPLHLGLRDGAQGRARQDGRRREDVQLHRRRLRVARLADRRRAARHRLAAHDDRRPGRRPPHDPRARARLPRRDQDGLPRRRDPRLLPRVPALHRHLRAVVGALVGLLRTLRADVLWAHGQVGDGRLLEASAGAGAERRLRGHPHVRAHESHGHRAHQDAGVHAVRRHRHAQVHSPARRLARSAHGRPGAHAGHGAFGRAGDLFLRVRQAHVAQDARGVGGRPELETMDDPTRI